MAMASIVIKHGYKEDEEVSKRIEQKVSRYLVITIQLVMNESLSYFLR